jgi:signal transduction histidine kinase
VFDLSHYALNPHAVPIVTIGIASLGLGLLVYSSNKAAAANRHFLTLCLSISAWLLATGAGLSSRDPTLALQWFKLDNAGVMFISVAFYAFSVEFLGLRRPRSILLGYVAASLLAATVLLTDRFVTGVHEYWWGYYPRWGAYTIPFFVVFFSYMAAAFTAYFQSFRVVHSPIKRNQITYVAAACFIGYLGSVDFLPVFGYEVYPFGYIPIFLLISVITYAIVKYRLMDISVAMEKGLNYLLFGTIVFVPSYAVLLIAQESYFGRVSHPFSLVVFLLFTLMVLGAYKFKGEAEDAIARIFFRKRYDTYKTLSKFSKALVTILDLKTLVEEIHRTLVTVMGVKTVTLYMLDKGKHVYAPVSTHGANVKTADTPRLTADNELPRHLAAAQTILVREEVEHFSGTEEKGALIDALRRVKADVCIPFVNKKALIGFCVLGPRTTRQMYHDQDLSLLTMLAQAAAIALDNAMLYEELKRSQSLVRRTDRLRSLETIAGGFAHEVRNPLTSIKTFIQLTPERKDDPEFIGHFSTVVSEDVARIERLIQEILDYARYMQPKFQEEDINVIVESCLYFIGIKADAKAVCLKKDLASDVPPVLLDRQQMKQVLLNLFINAIDAMGDHRGELIVRTHRLAKAPGDTWVQIEVTDTGCGISSADLEHIFDPFYTTKHESQEHEGTGLGLTIVHQIVHEHGGHIEVKSEPGRGTTFFVNLPAVPARVLEPPMEKRGV